MLKLKLQYSGHLMRRANSFEKPLMLGKIEGINYLTKKQKGCVCVCVYVDCSPPGSSLHEILQTRILEWVAIPFSKGPS